MATAKEKYYQLLDAVRSNKENRETMDKLVKYSKPMTSKLNHQEPVQYGVGQEPPAKGTFYPYIFQNAWDKRAEEEGDLHGRARQKLRAIPSDETPKRKPKVTKR
jgi:hypothetical protein